MSVQEGLQTNTAQNGLSLSTAYETMPLCPLCKLPIHAEYMRSHMRHDHTREETADMLALIAIEDYNEMFSNATPIEIKEQVQDV